MELTTFLKPEEIDYPNVKDMNNPDNEITRTLLTDANCQDVKSINSKNDQHTQPPVELTCVYNECNDINFIKLKLSDNNGAIDITPNQTGGILKQVLKSGNGDENPNHGNKVYIHYTGYLYVKDSLKVFYETKEKVCFDLGRNAVIRGLDYGISTMIKNEVALFIIQPEYAYGNLGNPPAIPPDAVLYFKVELFDWRLEDLSPHKDGGILRKVFLKGVGSSFPNQGAHIKAQIVGHFSNHIIEDRDVDFFLGEGCLIGIPEGVEIALFKFKLHEQSTLFLKAKYTSELHKKIDALTDDTVVEYEVALHFFKKAKEVWEMNSDEKYDQSVVAKTKGICYIQDGHYKLALKQFEKIETYLENEPGISPNSKKARKLLLISAYLNASLCQIKMERFFDAINTCDKVLSKDCKNEKALYRKGQCHVSINDCEEAVIDFQKVLEINPGNNAAKNSLVSCKLKMYEQKAKDRALYSNMFQKFVDQDEEKRKRTLGAETGVWERISESLIEDDDCDGVIELLLPFNYEK